jgi:hypothetical protein
MILKIGGYDYKVRLEKHWNRDNGASGSQCGNALEIYIDPDFPEQNKESTLLHEIIEAINYHYSLHIEHDKIMVLEATLYQVLKDNFKLSISVEANTEEGEK